MMIRRSIAILGLSVLMACSGGRSVDDPLAIFKPQDRKKIIRLLEDSQALRSFMTDSTVKTWSQSGTQIQYHSHSGRTWLVSPNFTQPLLGEWRVQQTPAGRNQICYMYSDADWTCQDSAQVVAQVDLVEVVDGDVLELQSRVKLPRPIAYPDNISIARAMQIYGMLPSDMKNKVRWKTKR